MHDFLDAHAYQTQIEPLLGAAVFGSLHPHYGDQVKALSTALSALKADQPQQFESLLSQPQFGAIRRFCHQQGISESSQQDEYLLVYGTLKAGYSNFNALKLQGRLECIEETTVQGELYHLGRYPGLVDGNEQVHCEVHQVIDKHVLPFIDKLEGWELNYTDAFYTRRCLRVVLPNHQSIDAWIYFYNRSFESSQPLLSGRWVE